MKLTGLLLICILYFNTLYEGPKEKSLFISPLRIPMSLSANFGELRIDHFHSGLDIKTQGVTGKEVFATAQGYIYRISISPGGFGRAIYMKHPSGYSTVYAHLDKFIPEIEDYVISRQYEEKSYMITLWPPKERFRFRQGDLIAFSGNSGSSTGPHLHFEIRKADDEIPVNPLQFDFGLEDNLKPVIEKLVIYPTGKNSVINNQNKPLKINVTGANGKYHLSPKSEIEISGSAGFGLQSYDPENGNGNKFSVYSIEIKIDTITVYDYRMDSFSFNESRYINSHIDYETYLRDNIYIERGFVLPNDRLSAYRNVIDRGIYMFNDDREHRIEINVADIFHNRSTLSFKVRSVHNNQHAGENRSHDHLILMPYNRNNRFVARNLIVNIPSGTLYDTLYFDFKKSAGNPEMYSDIYQIHNKYTPVHKAYSLSIKPERVPAGKESKLLIIQIDSDLKRIPLLSIREDGYVKATPNAFGTFFVGIDTVAPSILPIGPGYTVNLSGRSELDIKITDDLTGLKTYEPFIDGKWALFEYDQKNNQLIYRFDPKRITKGTKHTFALSATDNADNLSTYKCEFTW